MKKAKTLYRWYTVYDARTDRIVACGTAEMCYKKLGMSSKGVFFSMIYHSNLRNSPKRKYITVVEPISQRAYSEALWAQRKMQKAALPVGAGKTAKG